jgi:hypothetical protein
MRFFTQDLINGIDKTTEHGFAEALMISIRSLKNKNGLLVNVQFGKDMNEMNDFAMQIARMMLYKESK